MSFSVVKEERVPLLLRGIGGFLTTAFLNVSFRMIPLGDASAVLYGAPVFCLVIACLYLREECGFFQTFLLILTMIGVVLISRPSFLFGTSETEDPLTRILGVVVAAGGSFFMAFCYICVRKMPKTPPEVIIISYSLIASLCALIFVLVVKIFFSKSTAYLAQNIYWPTEWRDILIVVVVNGLTSVSAQVMTTMALKIEEAGIVSLASSVEVVTSFLLQAFWLPDQEMYWSSIAGAVIVCASVSLAAVKRWLQSKPGKWEGLWVTLNCGHKDREEYRELG